MLVRVIRQQKGTKDIAIRKEEIKLIADDMKGYVETPQNQKKTLGNNKREFKVTGYKVDMQTSIAFLYISNEQLYLNFKSIICNSKNKKN